MKLAAILLGGLATAFAIGLVIGVILLTMPLPEPSPASYAMPHGARPVR